MSIDLDTSGLSLVPCGSSVGRRPPPGMAIEDFKELLTSGGQLENVENDLYNDVNITASSITSEKKQEGFLTALEDVKAEEVNANDEPERAVEISMALVDGHEKTDELGDNDVENDKQVEEVDSSSKNIVRKRKKNAEEASTHTVSSASKMPKKKLGDASAMKMKELPLCDKSTKGNGKAVAKSDDNLESIEKGAIPEEEVEKTDGKDVKVGKKVEGMVNKATKITKQKIIANAKNGSPNAESTPTKSPNVVATEATSDIEENAKTNVEIDENLTSTIKISIPTIEKKDAEGTKDKPSPLASKKHLKEDDTAEKRVKKVDGMGLIFMCNAKTKKDCFKYNVLGLPESKKALVAEIYKGMRLFLFDFDLKLLYGIYKAASPGGYNIEPKAFGSKFPSQVRFTVLKDCLPLPEEKFKTAIKENYTRNKFDCQLSPEQVRKLCKLFENTTGSVSIRKHRHEAVRERTMPSSRTRELKRRIVRREAYPFSPSRVRHPSPPPRARYLSPPPRALPLQAIPRALPAPQLPSYTYERPGDDHYYRREIPRVLDLEIRPRDLPIGYRESYNLYREPAVYREPAYPPSLPLAYASRLREYGSPPRYLY